MDEEQRTFLNNRLNALAEQQPQILLLRDRLLELGGAQLVAPTNPDPDLENLLNDGCVIEAPIHLEEMAENSCHWNVASLWTHKNGGLSALGTGYALSDDGLWRQHSWGIRENAIFETTLPRTCYFGLRLEGPAADFFAWQHTDE